MGLVSAVVSVLATTAACSSGQPVGTQQTAPPVTVTVTTRVTTTVTQAQTQAPATSSPVPPPTTVTVTASSSAPEPSPTLGGSASDTTTGAEPTPSESTAVTDFATTVGLVVGYVALVAQIATIDSMTLTGPRAGAALDALAGQYRALRATPVPTTVDGPSYLGRLYSLELFAAAAAGEARSASPQAAARYGVIRDQTATLLALANGGLGTTFTLPSLAPTVAPPPSTTTTVVVP